MNKCFLIALGACALLLVLEVLFDAPALGSITFLLFCSLAFAVYLSSQSHHQLSWHFALIASLIAVTITPLLASPCYSNYLFLFNLSIVAIFLFEEKRTVAFYSVLCLAGLFIFTIISLTFVSLEIISFPILFNIIGVAVNAFITFSIIQIYLKNETKRIKELEYAMSLNKATINSTLSGILVIDNQGKITDYNERLISLWNLPEPILKSNSASVFFDFLGEQLEDANPLLEEKELHLHPASNVVCFKELQLKNGRTFEFNAHPHRLHQQIIGRVISFRDISEVYKAQQHLQQSEHRFRTIFNHSPIGIVMGGGFGRPMEHVNPRFCEMLGYSAEELKCMAVNDITFQKDQDIQKPYKKKTIDGDTTSFSLRKRYVRKNGELLWANVNVSMIKDEQGAYQGDIVLVEDITEGIVQEQQIKELLDELQGNNERLEQEVQKRTQDLQNTNTELLRSNEDLEQFAYVASHDLQEPLRTVGNFVQLLGRHYKDKVDEEGKTYINFAVEGVSRMSNLIQNLLKYSRVGRKGIAFRQVNVRDIIELKLHDLSQKIKETNADITFFNQSIELYCEPNQLGIVFYNLINNALKFVGTENPHIEIGWTEKESEFLFYVKDNGIGIEKQYEDKVFEIFKRLNRREEYEGTGIGLALCKKIITRHKGKIWLESTLGEGTTFYFTIHKSLKKELQPSSNSQLSPKR